MILRDELTIIGSIFKPHGIKGELSASFDIDMLPDEFRCIVLDIDGILVPFFIESYRLRGAESVLLKIDGINNEKDAAKLANHDIYVLTNELPDEDDDGVHLFDLEGYILQCNGETIGEIEEIDDSTANILMIVKNADDKTVLVPFVEELIIGLDTEEKIIDMDLPEGLLGLNE